MICIFENFLADPDAVRASAINSGFGSWKPAKGSIGSSVYEGMNFYGDHSTIIETIYTKAGFVGFPNSMCFRVTNETTERAYVHSDVSAGDMTCIVYLSSHPDKYGTGFYKHRGSGLLFMPPLEELAKHPDALERLKADINESSEAIWEEVEFAQGGYNRAVVFESHRWHRRFPEHGFGSDEHSGRMIWIGHFKRGKLS